MRYSINFSFISWDVRRGKEMCDFLWSWCVWNVLTLKSRGKKSVWATLLSIHFIFTHKSTNIFDYAPIVEHILYIMWINVKVFRNKLFWFDPVMKYVTKYISKASIEYSAMYSTQHWWHYSLFNIKCGAMTKMTKRKQWVFKDKERWNWSFCLENNRLLARLMEKHIFH